MLPCADAEFNPVIHFKGVYHFYFAEGDRRVIRCNEEAYKAKVCEAC